jgi:hypothetical protein
MGKDAVVIASSNPLGRAIKTARLSHQIKRLKMRLTKDDVGESADAVISALGPMVGLSESAAVKIFLYVTDPAYAIMFKTSGDLSEFDLKLFRCDVERVDTLLQCYDVVRHLCWKQIGNPTFEALTSLPVHPAAGRKGYFNAIDTLYKVRRDYDYKLPGWIDLYLREGRDKTLVLMALIDCLHEYV